MAGWRGYSSSTTTRRSFSAAPCIATGFRRTTTAHGTDLGLFDQFGERFVEIDETTEIRPGITLLMGAGSRHPRPPGNARLFVQRDGHPQTDDFDHELTMVLHDDLGTVVVTGCSHSGVLNMIDSAVERFPTHELRAVVGGFHLIGRPDPDSMALSQREVEEIGRSIHSRCTGPIFTGHCTGHTAFGVLQGVLGTQLRPLSTGFTADL